MEWKSVTQARPQVPTQGRTGLGKREKRPRIKDLGTRTVTATPSRIHPHINGGREPDGEGGDQDNPIATGACKLTDPKGTSHSRPPHPVTKLRSLRGEHSTRSGHENRISGTTQHEHPSTLLSMLPCVTECVTDYPRRGRNK
jgi:hypothetical protein